MGGGGGTDVTPSEADVEVAALYGRGGGVS